VRCAGVALIQLLVRRAYIPDGMQQSILHDKDCAQPHGVPSVSPGLGPPSRLRTLELLETAQFVATEYRS